MAQGREIDSLFWTLGANDAPFVAGIGRAQQSLKKITTEILSVRGALIGIGVVGALAFLKATSAAAKLDAPLREVSTLLPQTVEQMGDLRNEIIALSTRVPAPPEQLTKGLYQVISAGVTDTAEAMELLEVASKAATAGLATSQDAVLAITTVLNAYQLSASEAARVSDIFFSTIAQGVITFPQIADSIGRMATTAAQAGISIEEMTAALATMTKAGISAAEATTALNKLFLDIIQGELGAEFDLSAIAAEGFAATMDKLEQATRGDIKALRELVKSEESFRAASVLAGNQAGEFQRILLQNQDSAGATQVAYEKMTGSLQNQWELLKNKVNAQWLRLGALTLPMVVQSLETLNFFLGETSKLMRDISGFNLDTLDAEIAGVNVRFRSQVKIVDDLNEALKQRNRTTRGPGLRTTNEIKEAEEALRATAAELQALRQRRLDLRRAGPTELTELTDIGEIITEEMQELRDRLAILLQDEIVALTDTATDDMRLSFVRLRDDVIGILGEIPDEWERVLQGRLDEITEVGLEEAAEELEGLSEGLEKFRTTMAKPDLGRDMGELVDHAILLTRTLAELGQGFGLFGRDVASALNSITSVVQGVQGLGAALTAGTSIAGPAGLIAGGLASLGGLLFGGESENTRIMKENNKALERLTNAMEASVLKGSTAGGLIGAGISAIGGAGTFEEFFSPSLRNRNRARFAGDVEASLLGAGFTMEQLKQLAEDMGFVLDGSLAAWEAFVKGLQEAQDADVFEGAAGAMRRMRIEWDLMDTIDPIKKLADARKAWEELTGIAAPKNADEVLAFWERIKAGDTDFLGNLSPEAAIAFLQLIEGLLDESGGATTSFAVSRSITEVTGNRMAGLLDTGNFWAEQTALNTAGILDALGGSRAGLTPPSSVAVLGNTDVTIIVNGAGDPTATAIAVREDLIENLDRTLGERMRDTRRAQGRQQTDAFRG